MRLLFLCCLLSLIGISAFAADQPWLLSFPDISFDSKYAYFSHEKWTAVYIPASQSLTTLPTDSLKIPPPPVPSASAEVWNVRYLCVGDTLASDESFSQNIVRTLPPATRDILDCLPSRGAEPDPASLDERMGPVTARHEKLWFGLLLRDPDSRAQVAGVGWYDPALDRFGRLYTPDLANYRPEWIGSRDDSVYVLMVRGTGANFQTKLVAVSAANGGMEEVNWRAEGVPGRRIVAMQQWGDTLLFSTERAAAVWKPRNPPQSWESRAYATPQTCWLYLKTFPKGDPVRYMPLLSNTPTDVRAKVGSWYEVIAPVGIEGYVDVDDWGRHGVLWSQWRWGCDTCFVRLTIPMQGEMIPADFTNIMLTYIAHDANGVKVGFKAAWAREEDLVPVMMSPVPPKDQPE